MTKKLQEQTALCNRCDGVLLHVAPDVSACSLCRIKTSRSMTSKEIEDNNVLLFIRRAGYLTLLRNDWDH